MDVLLAGIVGSTAYGLAGPGSDIDRLGVFAAPTEAFHGLHRPQESIVHTGPDRTMHEAAKFCRLALGGNPTVLELMWLPDGLYETRTALGEELIAIRGAMLSAPRVRDAYLGYATQQFQRLENRGDGSFSATGPPGAPVPEARKRTAKHARHLARLVHQGRHLYATGQLVIRLDELCGESRETGPQWYHDFGDRVAGGDLDAARDLLSRAADDFAAIRTQLPDQPDEAAVERWLLAVRAALLAPR